MLNLVVGFKNLKLVYLVLNMCSGARCALVFRRRMHLQGRKNGSRPLLLSECTHTTPQESTHIWVPFCLLDFHLPPVKTVESLTKAWMDVGKKAQVAVLHFIILWCGIGAWVPYWLRRCATSRTVPWSIPGGVTGFFSDIFLPTVPWSWGRLRP